MQTKRTRNVTGTCVVIAVLAACSLSAQAAIIAYEDFEGLTATGLNGQGAGTGWNGAWTSNSAARVVTPGLDSSDECVRYHFGYGSLDSSRNLASGITIGGSGYTGTVYYGVTLKIASDTTSGVTAGLGGSGSILIGKWASSNKWMIYGLNAAGTQNITTYSTDDLVFNDEHRLVLKLDYSGSGATATLWVDPTSESSTPVIQGVGLTQNQRTSAKLSGGSVAGSSTQSRADNLQIATTFADAMNITPEPATMVLLGMGGLLGLVRRRTR